VPLLHFVASVAPPLESDVESAYANKLDGKGRRGKYAKRRGKSEANRGKSEK
jgi:hypothetical protein